MAATNVSLKLFKDKKGQQVLFAEADKKFVDFLLSIFTLPVGAVVRLLKDQKGSVEGSLPSLYQSFQNLTVNYIQPSKNKLFLLEPKVIMPGAEIPLLLPNVGSTFRQLYRCPSNHNYCSSYVADENTTTCPFCKSKMDRIVTYIDPPPSIYRATYKEGYVKESVAYMVMDDLEVKPLSSTTIVSLFTKFNVKVNRLGALEEKVVCLGMDEGLKLLKASWHSKTVLTDVFLFDIADEDIRKN